MAYRYIKHLDKNKKAAIAANEKGDIAFTGTTLGENIPYTQGGASFLHKTASTIDRAGATTTTTVEAGTFYKLDSSDSWIANDKVVFDITGIENGDEFFFFVDTFSSSVTIKAYNSTDTTNAMITIAMTTSARFLYKMFKYDGIIFYEQITTGK